MTYSFTRDELETIGRASSVELQIGALETSLNAQAKVAIAQLFAYASR